MKRVIYRLCLLLPGVLLTLCPSRAILLAQEPRRCELFDEKTSRYGFDFSKGCDEDWDSLKRLAGKAPSSIILKAWVISAPGPGPSSLTLVLSLTNLGDKPVHPLFFSSVNSVEVLMRSSSGAVVHWTDVGRQAWGRVEGNARDAFRRTIEPACAIGILIPLDKFFELSYAEKYQLLAAVDKSSTEELSSSAVVARPLSLDFKKSDLAREKEPDAGGDRNAEATQRPQISRVRPPIGYPRADGSIGATEDTKNVGPHYPKAKELDALMEVPYDRLTLEAVPSPENREEVCVSVSLRNTGRLTANSTDAIVPDSLRVDEDPMGVPDDEGERKRGDLPANRFRVKVRDDVGHELTINSQGEKWLRSHSVSFPRPLLLGDAVGFVFPLREMFDLQSGRKYTCVFSLSSDDGKSARWTAAPVKIKVLDNSLRPTK